MACVIIRTQEGAQIRKEMSSWIIPRKEGVGVQGVCHDGKWAGRKAQVVEQNKAR